MAAPLLAENTKRVLKERGWSHREAQEKTGVNYATVRNMCLGGKVQLQFILQWAHAIQENPFTWAEWAGYALSTWLPNGTERVAVQLGTVLEIRTSNKVTTVEVGEMELRLMAKMLPGLSEPF